MDAEEHNQSGLNKLELKLQNLEERLGKVEMLLQRIDSEKLTSAEITVKKEQEDIEIQLPFKTRGSIEIGFGEYGMAWLGNIVLLFGITFLAQNLLRSGNAILSVITGYLAVALIYAGARFTKKAYSYLSKLLLYNGHIILFVITLRLHFFQPNPVFQSSVPALALLLLIIMVLLFIAFKQKIPFLAGLALLMLLVTGIAGNTTHLTLGAVLLVSILAVALYYRFQWIKPVFIFVPLGYITYLIWMLNNPLVSGEAVFREVHQPGIIYLFLIGLAYSAIAVLPKNDTRSGDWIIAAIVWNGLAFTSILALTVLTYYLENYVLIFSFTTLFCLLFSVLLKKFSSQEIIAPMYAIYGFVAMSISIYGVYLFPKAYLLLSVQSFLVVSMALWFRSRFLVITNTILFLFILAFYIKDPVVSPATDFTFMFVAFISARVMNWKKERLNLQTEFIRNMYLIAGFTMTLIALNHALPNAFVTVSWIGAALMFFVFSYLIRNVKYRWLAIASMLASAVRLVFVDMKSMDISFRILVFLLLAIISITVSVVYTRFLRNRQDPDKTISSQ